MKSAFLLKSHMGRTGGAEKYARRMVQALQKKSYNVTLLTSGPMDHSPCAVVSCPNTPLSFLSVLRFDRFCQTYAKQNPCSHIFSLDRTRFQTHIRASNGVHAAYLKHRKKHEAWFKNFSFACNPLHRLLLSIEKESFENPDLRALITNSHMVKQEILAHYRVDPSKIHVVHNGVEWQECASDFAQWKERRPAILRQKNLPSSTFHLLFIGHNYQRKGLVPLLNALKHISLPIHLSVVGKDKNMAYFKYFVQKEKIEHQVSFFPNERETYPFFQYADALIIPSFYDPFANVTVEALAMGVPVISSRTNGGHEILTSENGHIIEDVYDKDSLISTITAAYHKPKTTQSALSIRQSASSLDFSKQLPYLLQAAGL
jgi:UDP-glucose:(heptosyl)LPS alpha-1,3-glucosyltransferase